MTTLTMTAPDDWHIHLREGEYLKTTVAHASAQFERVIVMPNLTTPITSVMLANQYRADILKNLPPQSTFQPLMTLYLTNHIAAKTIIDAKDSGIVFGCKLYPAGSTTNSQSGVASIQTLYPIFDMMQAVDLPLLIHGEVTDPSIDIFDREAKFIEDILSKLIDEFPDLRVVLEHVTTKEAVEFVKTAGPNVAATITPHHLLLNRNDLLAGGLRPHHYCLPVLKRQTHQEALLMAATQSSGKFFIGTDSAPHAITKKESACGCAGIYSAHAAIELYAEAFEHAGALNELEAFCSFYGPDFYKLPRNKHNVELRKESWQVPEDYNYGNTKLIPFRSNTLLSWKLYRHE